MSTVAARWERSSTLAISGANPPLATTEVVAAWEGVVRVQRDRTLVHVTHDYEYRLLRPGAGAAVTVEYRVGTRWRSVYRSDEDYVGAVDTVSKRVVVRARIWSAALTAGRVVPVRVRIVTSYPAAAAGIDDVFVVERQAP